MREYCSSRLIDAGQVPNKIYYRRSSSIRAKLLVKYLIWLKILVQNIGLRDSIQLYLVITLTRTKLLRGFEIYTTHEKFMERQIRTLRKIFIGRTD